MEKYTGYWGKNFTTPMGYRLYPPNVDELYFKCYEGTTSEAIQALKLGAIDYVDWMIPTAAVQDLQSDPDVSLSYLPENGYYYLAFNEKLDPMGDLSFRQAVSHLIDKNQIVSGGCLADGCLDALIIIRNDGQAMRLAAPFAHLGSQHQ